MRRLLRWMVLPAAMLAACTTSSGPEPPATTVEQSTAAGSEAGPGATSGTTSADASATSTPVDPDAVLPEGFDLVQARVTEPDGTVCDLCLWLAADADQRRRGLMFVTDLGPADGMAFRYPSPHSGRFWMRNTVLPLSIAFYSPSGGYLDAFDMEPCLTESCPRYPTPDKFLIAVETYQGGLADIGMVPGSTLELLDLPCE